MDWSRTPTSGQGLTLITGLGGRPVDRSEVESWCRTRATDEHRRAPRTGVGSAVPTLVSV